MEPILVNLSRKIIDYFKPRVGAFKNFNRQLQTSSYLLLNDGKPDRDSNKNAKEPIETNTGTQGWVSRFLSGPRPNPSSPRQSHSSLLSDSPYVYEIAIHDTKPGERERYLEIYKDYAKELKKSNPEIDLLGSWKVFYNYRDQAVHLWRYNNGDIDADRTIDALVSSSSLKAADREVALLLNRRKNVLAKSFGYWREPEPRKASNIYELRIYTLKPGSMYEWGSAWATGITYRRDDNQDVGGFFTKVGHLYTVYHLWAYKSLVHRNEIRQKTWNKPGWAQTVSFTGKKCKNYFIWYTVADLLFMKICEFRTSVPLIQWSESKIMVPTELSQLK